MDGSLCEVGGGPAAGFESVWEPYFDPIINRVQPNVFIEQNYNLLGMIKRGDMSPIEIIGIVVNQQSYQLTRSNKEKYASLGFTIHRHPF